MALADWIEEGSRGRSGGQGVVTRVRHAHDGRVGALKRLHPDAAIQKERRFRMSGEIGALRVMGGDGVPRVLESNEAGWEEPGAQLYLVMEFIAGPTLTEIVQRTPPSLDEALACTRRMLEILQAGHAIPLHHRDLKPDNVIIRDGVWADPVLVDLGIAWHGSDDREFETPDGCEMGNRFLRLPEFAPRGDHRDARSDLAMAAGLLHFMVSGQAPRLPVDQNGRHPHQREPDEVRPEVLADRRWPALSRILTVAFQPDPRSRHQDAAEMRGQLDALDAEPDAIEDELDREIARLRDLTGTAEAQTIERARPAMAGASAELYGELGRLWGQAGLMHAGQGPTFHDGGTTNRFYCVLSRLDLPDPSIVFRHVVMVAEGRFRANWSIDGGPAGDGHYDGPAADGQGLHDACLAHAWQMAGVAVRALNERMSNSRRA